MPIKNVDSLDTSGLLKLMEAMSNRQALQPEPGNQNPTGLNQALSPAAATDDAANEATGAPLPALGRFVNIWA